jgi:nucleotide-binding universal stress UspA family protein
MTIPVNFSEPKASTITEKRVLLIIDGSPPARTALESAWKLAHEEGGIFRIVYLLRNPWLMYSSVLALDDDPERLVEIEAQIATKTILDGFPEDVGVDLETRRESVREAKARYSSERHFDLIFVGARGSRRWWKALPNGRASREWRLPGIRRREWKNSSR